MTQPKRIDVVGSPEQAFAHKGNVLSHLLRGIKSNSIAAVGFISPTGQVQAAYAPQIHMGVDGNPIFIVGNASGKLDKFSLIILHLSLGLLHCFKKTNTFEFLNKLAVESDLLKKSKWKDGQIFGWAIPNIVFFYYGNKVPQFGPKIPSMHSLCWAQVTRFGHTLCLKPSNMRKTWLS